MKKLFIVSLLLLDGCTQAQMQAMTMKNGMNEAKASMYSCFDPIYKKARYTPIIEHIPPYDAYYLPTFAEMNNSDKPTKEEAKLIQQFHDETESCRQMGLRKIAQVAPSIAPILLKAENDGDNLSSKLVTRKISWGAYAKQAQLAQTQLSIALSQEAARIDSSLSAQHQLQEQQMRDGLMQAAQINMQQQQITAQQNAAFNQNRVNCTSYQQGYYTHTNCY